VRAAFSACPLSFLLSETYCFACLSPCLYELIPEPLFKSFFCGVKAFLILYYLSLFASLWPESHVERADGGGLDKR
jgi:hypothetical protein